MKNTVKLLFVLLLLVSCSTTMKTNINKKYDPLPSNTEIIVGRPGENIPEGSEILGTIRIGDSGLSVGCSLEQVVQKAKEKAISVGGNAIKITSINEPDFTSTCYRITAQIIRLKTFSPSDTHKLKVTESELTEYFDNNKLKLKPIEGIWTVNSIIEEKYSGEKRIIQNRYKIAITKKDFNSPREFDAIIISSDLEEWNQLGLVKAELNSTAYQNTYTVEWINANGTKSNSVFSIERGGLAKGVFDQNIYTEELTLLKSYPEFNSDKNITEQDINISGTGFVISSNGIVATNYHVVEGANNIKLSFSGTDSQNKTYKAELILNDKSNDIALLKINDPEFSKFENIPYGLDDDYSIGGRVFTIGYPLNEIMGRNYKLSEGIVSSNTGIKDDARYLQITTPVQPGNSGGPLFNSNGDVIGIVTSRLNDEAINTKVENVNYAIKSDYITTLVKILPDVQSPKPNQSLIGEELPKQVSLLKNFICLIEANN